MYGDVVLGMKPENKEEIDPFEAIIQNIKAKRGIKLDNEMTVADLKELVTEFKKAIKSQTGNDFPTDPMQQLWGAILRCIHIVDEQTCHSLSQDGRYSTRMGVQQLPFRQWYSATWAKLLQRVYASLAMLVMERMFSMANIW